ncbi:MAG: signal peptidase I [Anaerolineales bacterium]|nr:signal peptidase I [Anaerolineales bacterium]
MQRYSFDSSRTELTQNHEIKKHLSPDSPEAESVFTCFNAFRTQVFDLIKITVVAALLYTSINTITERVQVLTISMVPYIFVGDMLVVNKFAYEFNKLPARGDVILFNPPAEPDSTPFVKRVIGLPGETVEVKDGIVFINGNPIDEGYLQFTTDYEGVFQVGNEEYFVLGDNRNRSSDSHIWGNVPTENVIGKVILTYWPPQHWKLILNPINTQ